jgi:hypothetical protein
MIVLSEAMYYKCALTLARIVNYAHRGVSLTDDPSVIVRCVLYRLLFHSFR